MVDINKNPVPLLTVKMLSSKDSSQVKYYTFTNEQGHFSINQISPDKYILQFSLMGLETYQREIDIKEDLQLETIVLSEQTIDLEEIVLIANKKGIELTDKGIRLNVKGTSLENQRNVMSILKFAPNMNGLQIMGSSDVKLSVNGKDVKINIDHLDVFLNSLNPNLIKNIEVIDRSDASFEGNVSGQINIEMEGGKGFSVALSNTISRNNRYGLTANPSIFYTLKNLRLYSFYYQNFNTSQFRSQEIQIIDGNLTYDTYRNASLKRQERVFSFGADFTLDSLNSISFIYDYTGDNDREFKILSEQNIHSANSSDSIIRNLRKFEHFYKVHTLSMQYQKKLDTLGSTLKLSSDFASDSYRNPLTDENDFFSDGQLVNTTKTSQSEKTNSKIYALELYWSKKFNSRNTLSLGSKYTFNKNGSSFLFFDVINNEQFFNDNFSNDFDFNENIYAIYSDYQIKFKKSSLSFGMRFEHNVNRFGENRLDNTNDNFKWLPSISYNLPINDSHYFSFYMSKKINRPSYYHYNPTLVVSSPTQASSGNPDLDPTDIYRIQLSYNFKQKYRASLRYDYLENNLISEFKFIDEGGFTLSRPENTGYRNNLYLMLSLPAKFFTWWESNNKLNLNYTNFSTPLIVPKKNIEATFGNIDSYHTFNLSDALSLEFDLSYATPRKSTYRRYSDNFSADASITYSFLKDQIKFNVWLSDIFNTQRDLAEYQFNEIFRRTNTKENTRMIFLNLTYNFGFGKEVSQELKDSNIKDEKRRVRH
ncbi:MAG: outer membrane beta-barrel family protein [Flavobacteriaceae bacterium]|nr:outer membrane beta-barrel family protein [Flavobacteriaceae bacterium]